MRFLSLATEWRDELSANILGISHLTEKKREHRLDL